MNNKGYDKLSDEELIQLTRSGHESATAFIMEKYKNLVRQKARTLFLIGGDRDDLIQEGMIGLYKAIRDYQQGKEASFFHFADICISRQIYSAIKASYRKKNMPLNTYVSLNAPAYFENPESEEQSSLMDMMLTKKSLNPEELLIDKENANMLEYELGRRLSTFEKKVLQLYLGGLKYGQIAEELDKTPKSIDNALQRIKVKMNQILKEL
jgi:RNA polymerase sporulation-specific sigma factor